jgi:hypothetical protein
MGKTAFHGLIVGHILHFTLLNRTPKLRLPRACHNRPNLTARAHDRILKVVRASPLRMKTSRAAVDRLLDASNPSVTLGTLGKAASVLGQKLSVKPVPA